MAVEALQAIGIDAAGLANNHALDYEADALADTADHLRLAGIAAVGAGPTSEAARRGVVVEGGRIRIGLLAVSDHPSEYAANEGAWGIAYADLRKGVPAAVLSEIERLGGSRTTSSSSRIGDRT